MFSKSLLLSHKLLDQSSGVTGGGGGTCPWYFLPGIFCWPNGEEKKENLKGKRWKMEGKITKMGAEDLYFFTYLYLFFCFCFVFCFLFCLFVFFFLFCHFLKPLKLCWGQPRWTIFSREKAYFRLVKNRQKWLCSLWKIFLLRHWTQAILF